LLCPLYNSSASSFVSCVNKYSFLELMKRFIHPRIDEFLGNNAEIKNKNNGERACGVPGQLLSAPTVKSEAR